MFPLLNNDAIPVSLRLIAKDMINKNKEKNEIVEEDSIFEEDNKNMPLLNQPKVEFSFKNKPNEGTKNKRLSRN